MILILTNNYPSENNLYANAFVHRRALAYKQNNIEVKVFVCKKTGFSKYKYENIDVIVGDSSELYAFLKNERVDKLCIHFLSVEMINALEKIHQLPKIYIFVHGNEALFWFERLFKSSTSLIHNFLVIVNNAITNTYSILRIRKFIHDKDREIKFIAVSNWMMEKTCKNWKINSKNFYIIPNYVDNDLFKYKKKSTEYRLKILSIRPYSSSKYANDISINFIQELSKLEFFDKLEFKIVGKGNMFNYLTDKVKSFKNVSIENCFLSQEDIKKYHDKYGIFLCPTRQDAQGVSMCEAISSGLVPLTLSNTAIPEFVSCSEILSDNIKEMVDVFKMLYYDPDKYLNYSKQLAQEIRNKCGYNNTIKKELDLVLGD